MCFGGEMFDTQFRLQFWAKSYSLSEKTLHRWANYKSSLLNGSLQIVTRNIRCSTLVQVR